MDKELFDLDIINRAKERQKEKDRILKEQLEKINNDISNAEMIEMRKARILREDSIKRLPGMVKESFVKTFLDKMYTTILENLDIKDENHIRYNMINEYMTENTALNIVRNMSHASEFLSDVAYQINEATASILEGEKGKDENIIIKVELDDSDRDKFLESLDNVSIEQLGEKIAMRVQQAQADFIHYNQEDQNSINDIITATQEKVGSTVKESYHEGYNYDCKRAIEEIKKRPKSIFECVVNKICMTTYNNDVFKEQFLTENSSLNLDTVLETATIMYTFLEMTNSLRMVNVDESYILDLYETLK